MSGTAATAAGSLTARLPGSPEPDSLYEAFEAWCAERGLELYPAQQEALIELFTGANVILATPTGLGQEPGRDRRALRRAGRGAPDVLHGSDQGAGVGEVLRARRHVRRRPGRHAHRGREREPDRADHLLHGGGAGQPGPARGGRGRRRPGRDGRVPLLRRARPRLGLAGADPRAAARAVPAHVGDPRRHDAPAGGPVPAHRPADGRGQPRRAPGAVVLLVRDHAGARDDRGAAAHRPGPDLRRPLHPGRRARAGAGADEHQRRQPGGEGRDRRGDRLVPLLRRLRPDALAPRPARDRRAPRRHAAALPAAGRAARAGGRPQGDLRHRHPRRRHQRPDPHRRPHRAEQVRRHPAAAPQGPRVPPDRRPRGPGRLRHRRHRRRPGPRPRGRERAAARQGGRRPEEAPQGRAQEGARGVRLLGAAHLRAARRPPTPSR